MKYFFFVLILSIYSGNKIVIFSQNNFNNYKHIDIEQVIPSSGVAALGKHSEFPMVEKNGLPDISIPLHNIITDNISIPISLNYHGSGIKVAQFATWVGLGWNLTAGGQIIREVKDLPDDENFYIKSIAAYRTVSIYEKLKAIGWLYQEDRDNFNAIENPSRYLAKEDYHIDIKEVNPFDVRDWNPVPAYTWVSLGKTNDQKATDLIRKLNGEFLMGYYVDDTSEVYVSDYHGHSRFMHKKYDKEPDIFYVSLPGLSVKFSFGHDGEPKLIGSSKNIKIIPQYSSQDPIFKHQKILGFELTDEKGNIYTFSEGETSRTERQDTYVNVCRDCKEPGDAKCPPPSAGCDESVPYYLSEEGTNPDVDFEYALSWVTSHTTTTGWYLTKVQTASGKTIDFSYSDFFEQKYERNSSETNRESYTPIMEQGSLYTLIKKSKNIRDSVFINKRYLNTIKSNNETVSFTTINRMDDLYGGKLLESLSISINNNDLKNISFEYNNQQIENCSDASCTRIYLESIVNSNYIGDIEKKTRFEYYKKDLLNVDRFSKNIDHWGFYNGNGQESTLIPKLYVYPERNGYQRYSTYPYRKLHADETEIVINGSNREADIEKVKFGSLHKIHHPTGGYTEYIFESNQFFDPLAGIKNIYGGGLRIKEIRKFESKNAFSPVLKKTYSYNNSLGKSSGYLIRKPMYAKEVAFWASDLAYLHTAQEFWEDHDSLYFLTKNYQVLKAKWNNNTIELDSIHNWSKNQVWDRFTERTSNSYSSLNDLHGPIVQYTHIEINEEGNGKTILNYNTPNNYTSANIQPLVKTTLEQGHPDYWISDSNTYDGSSNFETIFSIQSHGSGPIVNVYYSWEKPQELIDLEAYEEVEGDYYEEDEASNYQRHKLKKLPYYLENNEELNIFQVNEVLCQIGDLIVAHPKSSFWGNIEKSGKYIFPYPPFNDSMDPNQGNLNSKKIYNNKGVLILTETYAYEMSGTPYELFGIVSEKINRPSHMFFFGNNVWKRKLGSVSNRLFRHAPYHYAKYKRLCNVEPKLTKKVTKSFYDEQHEYLEDFDGAMDDIIYDVTKIVGSVGLNGSNGYNFELESEIELINCMDEPITISFLMSDNRPETHININESYLITLSNVGTEDGWYKYEATFNNTHGENIRLMSEDEGLIIDNFKATKNLMLAEVSNYTYGENSLPSKKSFIQSEGAERITEYTYPQDFPDFYGSNEDIDILKSKNIHTPILVESKILTQGTEQLLEATYNSYSNPVIVKPTSIHKVWNPSITDISVADFYTPILYTTNYKSYEYNCNGKDHCLYETDEYVLNAEQGGEIIYTYDMYCPDSYIYLYVDGVEIDRCYPTTEYVEGVYTISNPIEGKAYKTKVIYDGDGSLINESEVYISERNTTYDNPTYIFPNIFTKEMDFQYDDYGNLIQQQKNSDVETSYQWGYNNTLPIAKVVNAEYNEIFFDSFEENDLSGKWWTWLGTWSNSTIRSKTGELSLRSTNNSESEVFIYTPELLIDNRISKKYKASCWVYSHGPSAQLFLFYSDTDQIQDYTDAEYVTISTTGKWTYLEVELTVPSTAKSIFARVDNNSNGTVYYDDLSIYPSDAQMTSYTYDPLIGMTSITDPRGQTVHYEYDGFGRLERIIDHEGNILEEYKYNYAQ
jgi:YD repeat-containing protein